jgi:hypothetical protein
MCARMHAIEAAQGTQRMTKASAEGLKYGRRKTCTSVFLPWPLNKPEMRSNGRKLEANQGCVWPLSPFPLADNNNYLYSLLSYTWGTPFTYITASVNSQNNLMG